LLLVVLGYKAGKAGEGLDRETVRSKCEDVTKCFWKNTLIKTRIKSPDVSRRQEASTKTESKTN